MCRKQQSVTWSCECVHVVLLQCMHLLGHIKYVSRTTLKVRPIIIGCGVSLTHILLDNPKRTFGWPSAGAFNGRILATLQR